MQEWYRGYELTHGPTKHRVYVASDDPKVSWISTPNCYHHCVVQVLGECRKKYPDTEFLGDPAVARSAAVSSRYSDSSLRGVIQDIHLLSLTDHLVCTFSSQVWRQLLLQLCN